MVLSRRTDLKQSKGYGKDSDKGYETFLAALAGGKMAVEKTRELGCAESLAHRDQEFLHPSTPNK
jgi:hypothetical protein